MVGVVVGAPDFSRMFECVDDIAEGPVERLGGVGDVVLLTQGLH